MKLKKYKSLLLFGLIISISSCRKDKAQAVESNSANARTAELEVCNDSKNQVTYYKDIKPILDEYCVSCHNSEASENRGKPPSSFADYTSARAWGYLMPGFRLFQNLSTEDQQVIQDWIDGGLTEVDYNDNAKQIIDSNCVTCHDAEAPKRKDLPNTNFESPDIVRIMGSQIPMFGPLKNVTAEQQTLLEQWVRDGLPLGTPP